MNRSGRFYAAVLAAVVGLAGTRWQPAAAQAASTAPSASPRPPVFPQLYPVTPEDVNFVTGMIAHHSQAIVMAKWAPTHGASEDIQTLCSRIINAQTDEIALMQRWLQDRHQPVPEAKPVPMKMMMNGVETEMLMPGMLTDEQMKQLDAARGTDFDHLFLRFMIQHHRGAVQMVTDLFAAGAGQDEGVFKMANDIQADQTTEINRMARMFLTMPGV
ncbi:MAG TPA: DUF305 domain-containing protein [Gemmatimonadales bacterium]